MELSNNDLKNAILQTMDDKFRGFTVAIDDKFRGFTVAIDDKFRLNNDLLLQEMKAMEYRIDKKLAVQKDEILLGVGEIIGGSVLLQIDNHEQRLVAVEAKISVKV